MMRGCTLNAFMSGLRVGTFTIKPREERFECCVSTITVRLNVPLSSGCDKRKIPDDRFLDTLRDG